MSKYKGTILLLFLLSLSSCKKDKHFELPEGKWVFDGFVFVKDKDKIYTSNYDYYAKLKNSNYKLKKIELNKPNYSNLFFEKNGYQCSYSYLNGTEHFKLKKEKIDNKNGIKTFQLTLKHSKKGKFYFTYDLIGDTLLIGDYWIKDQKYYSKYIPNYETLNFMEAFISNGITKYSSSYDTFEILAIFKKEK